jgi:L-serine kinase (ADP)
MNVIILAAGRGTRFEPDTPKCLCPIGLETIVSRQIKQIRTYLPDSNIVIVAGFEHTWVQEYCQGYDADIIVCYNGKFAEDKNIYSGLRGIESVDGGTLIIEGDCIFSDTMFEGIRDRLADDDTDTIFFLGGAADKDKTNGVVKTDSKGRFEKYTIGEKDDVADSYNMTGVTWIPEALHKTFMDELRTLSEESMDQYYFEPLVRNSKSYSTYTEVLGDECYTFNTKEEYLAAYESLDCNPVVELFDVSKLVHIEDYDKKAAKELEKKIKKDNRWTRPLCIDPDGLVMDGQHRMEVALSMKLSKVPVIIYNYDEVPIYSLRDDEKVSHKKVKKKAKKGDIYPYKTVKHVFNEDDLICDYALTELK